MIGEVVTDFAVESRTIRLGGVFHAARALSAFGVAFSVGYIAPSYLRQDIEKYLDLLGCELHAQLGEMSGSPGVVVALDETEAGGTQYEDLLRDSRRSSLDDGVFQSLLKSFRPSDVLSFPGAFDLDSVLSLAASCGARSHVDVQYGGFREVIRFAGPIESLFLSTSSSMFAADFGENPSELQELAKKGVARSVLLKENRGGARVWTADAYAETGAFTVRTAHSIGVGDCFDARWVIRDPDEEPARILARCSIAAAAYASTWSFEDFEALVSKLEAEDDLGDLPGGFRLAWEERAKHTVYIAAPDFPGVDTRNLDRLETALRHHGFAVIRPVRQFGLLAANDSDSRAQEIFDADLDALQSSSVVVAVPIEHDSGTYVELGFARARGIPTVLWNLKRDRNPFLNGCARHNCATLTEVVEAVFQSASTR